MDPSQIENAIQIAWSQTSDHSIRAQALDFIHQLRSDPGAWQACLSLFTRSPPPPEPVRHFCLEVLSSAVQTLGLDTQSLEYIRGNLMDYVRQNYGGGAEKADTAHIQNKLSQLLTYLFAGLYASSWQSFFDDFLSLAENGAANENMSGSILYFRLLGSIHDEIADILIARSPEDAKRNVILKDLIRNQDAQKVAIFWQEILSKWRQIDLTVVEMCLKTISRWVSWVDISLVVNQPILDALLGMAGQQDLGSTSPNEIKVRDAAIDTFTEIASKKMRPAEKMELIKVLNLATVVGQLTASPALEEYRNTPKYDTDLAEAVAKLVNNVVRDCIIVLDAADADNQTKQQADEILQVFVPYLLRFFSDEYDEVCSTVIDGLSELLTFFRRAGKGKASVPFPSHYTSMLQPILTAIVAKMKYDETATWGDEDDEADEAEFIDLRKKLNILQQQVAAIDEPLYIAAVSALVSETFGKVYSNQQQLDWRELDLALYEVYLFGDLAARNKGLYQKHQPSSPAAQTLVVLLEQMVQSNIGNYAHPAIQLQYMEICVRYSQFFQHNINFIPPALDAFVRFCHSDNLKVRTQAWYHFQRFVRSLRGHMGQVAQTVIQAISDLLTIKASMSGDNDDDDSDGTSNETNENNDPVFNSQLYLFEAIGCIASASTIPIENKILYTQSIINPIFSDLERNLGAAENGDERSIMQVHHDIMAIGNLSHGFTDWMPGVKASEPLPTQMSDEFVRCGEAILVALESLNSSFSIRQAARYSFSRLLGGMGTRVFQQLPRWIEGLLSQTSSKDEMSFFLRLLGQTIFAFKTDISSILDAILSPLLQRMFERLSEPVTGTDDEMSLTALRREFLNFVFTVLNYDLGSVFISSNNQSIFENVITAIEHFARDATDLPTARTAFQVLTRMTVTWGGPDIAALATSNPPPNSPTNLAPTPVIPGFDTFAINRFSPLSWAIPSTDGFKVRDPTSRLFVQEIAVLQQEILKKTGEVYINALRSELGGMGLGEPEVEVYLQRLRGDTKGFKEFLVGFLGRGES